METHKGKSWGVRKIGRESEREADGAEKKCSGSMLASDKGISLPPVGRSESLKL